METSRICEVNGVRLHVIEAGERDGPLVILLHGFPDFWWGWRAQIEALSAEGYRLVVPDMRGYGPSSKPEGVSAYDLDVLAADVVALADFYGRATFRLAGHDWGGIIAWHVAHRFPGRVERVAILNAPQLDTFMRYVRRHPTQMLRSSYAAFFQLPWLPERVLHAGNFAFLRRTLQRSSRPGTFSAADVERYVEAWSAPGRPDRDDQLLPRSGAQTAPRFAAHRAENSADLGRARRVFGTRPRQGEPETLQSRPGRVSARCRSLGRVGRGSRRERRVDRVFRLNFLGSVCE